MNVTQAVQDRSSVRAFLKKPVSNKDLWIKIDKLNTDLAIEWIWVKAHQSDGSEDTFYNNMADELATGAIIK